MGADRGRVSNTTSVDIQSTLYKKLQSLIYNPGAQELCERRGGRPHTMSLIVLMVSVDVKQH